MPTATAAQPRFEFLTERLRARARERARARDHAEAARLYQTVLDADPDDLEVALRLAHHWRAAEQIGLATRADLRAARILAHRGAIGRAQKLVDRALQAQPAMMTAAALRPCASALGPAAVPLLHRVADAHQACGRVQQARDVLRLAADIDPMRIASVLRLVDVELGQADVAEAVGRLDELGRGLLRMGRVRDFVPVAERLIALRPDDAFFLRWLGQVYLRAGETSRALPKLIALMRLRPDDAALVLRVAELHARVNNRGAALSALERWAWMRAGASNEYQAEVEAALERALQWIPRDASWRRALIELGISTWGTERRRTINNPGFDLVVLPTRPPPPPVWSTAAPKAVTTV